jgi:flavin-dependent dehydrogenase
MSRLPQSVEYLVIGGGLAGSMAALRLAEAGREVLLVERERGPRPKVCGEFLSAEAVEYLRAAGVDPQCCGARSLKGLRFSAGKRVIETELPFSALALSREILDEQLLRRAEDRGCVVARGVAVERLIHDAHGWQAGTDGDETVRTAHVVLASGKHDIRGWARGNGTHNDLIGFKMRWRLTHDLGGSIELHHFAGGYAGLVAVEDGAANLSAVVRRAVYQRIGGWPALLTHMCRGSRLLNDRLAGADAAWDRPMAVASLPYGYLARDSDGCWRVGDQAAVIPSFTGDGMAIALHSAVMAVAMMLAGRSIDEYQRVLAAQLRGGMRIATGLSRLMASEVAGVMAPAAMAVLPYLLGSIARATRIPSCVLQVPGV